MHRLAGGVLAAVLVLGAAGCGDDDEATPSTTTPGEVSGPQAPSTPTVDPASEFPPNDVAALKGIFDPLVEPLGVRLTRGVVVDRTDGWEVSDTGTHLALYVEPIDDAAYATDDYVENIYAIAAAVIPQVFEPHEGILTFDICQEPYQADDDRYEPFPATQIELTREQAAAFDWETSDLPDLLRVLHTEEGARIQADRAIKDSPRYIEAMESAGLDPET